MKRIFLFILFAVSLSQLHAQHSCGTDEAVRKMRAANPEYDAQMAAWKDAISQIIENSTPTQTGARGQLYTIPVVVHIVLNSQTLANNITNAIVQQQIVTLTNDFRKLNSNFSTVRAIFQPIAADVELEFCLAVRDPSGNATNGIERKWTGVPSCFSVGVDSMKFNSQGGLNAWNPQKYLNIWVVAICGTTQFGGVGGWAYLPSPGVTGSSVDGIVLDYRIGFGSNYRSLTHETGHYFGLGHTWGDQGGCSNDDGISDTPESASANQHCIHSTNSCNTGTGDLPDQLENYMDYSTCPAMFTEGQKTVMRGILTGSRASLITNNLGCQGVNVPPVANFSAASTSVCTGSSVTFTDNSQNSPTSWSWSFQGGTPSTSTQQSPTVSYVSAGVYNVTLTATNAFGSDSETKTGYITVGSGGTETLLSADFEGTFPGSWTIVNPDGGITWEAVTVGGSSPGTRAARVNCFNYQTIGQRDGLVSPVIDLTGHTQVSLTFHYAHRRYSTNETDSLIVYVSTNGGTTFPTRVFAKAGGAGFATGNTTQNDFVPSANTEWCTATTVQNSTCPVLDLSAYSGLPNVRLKFEIVNDYGNNIYIDNVSLTGVCSGNAPAPVADFTASQTSGCNSITVSFTDQSTESPTSWSWQFTGGTPATSTQQNPSVTYNTPGTYSVTLTATNANGSNSNTKTGYITVYAGPAATTSRVNASCPGVNNGSIDVTVIGGTSPFTYQWTNGASSQDLNGLGGGSYSVTVTDFRSCTATASATISVGAALQLSANVQDDTGGNTGSIAVSVANGTAPYTYQWTSGGTTATISNLAPGSYAVTVTDASGCQATASYTVNGSNSAPAVNFTASQTSGCGSITVSFTDQSTGTPTSWNWQFPGGNPSSSAQRNPTVTYSSPGSYNVTLTAANANGGNSKTNTSYIIVHQNPAATISKTDATCPGAANGAASLNVSGGTPPYEYDWSNNATTQNLSNVAAGTYTVTVNDANDCTAFGSVTIASGAGLLLSASIQDDNNGSGIGSITVSVTNGIAPYGYAWSNGGTSATISGLDAGPYTVSVMDASGCEATATFTVGDSGQPPVAGFTANITSGCDALTVNFTDETVNSPTSWNWQFQGGNPSSSTQRNPVVSYDRPGTYNVTLTSTNGSGSNTASVTGYIIVHASPVTSVSKADASCPGVSNGSVDLTVVGSSPPFSYSWSNSITTQDLTGIGPGSYSVTVTDASGCTSSKSVLIDEGDAISLSANVSADTAGIGTGSLTVKVTNGTEPYAYLWNTAAASATITGLQAGDYSVTVTDAAGCQGAKTFTVPFVVSAPPLGHEGWSLNVRPNPAKDLLNVTIMMPEDAALTLVVYNLIGKELLRENFIHSKEVNAYFNVRNFESGAYFLRMESQGRSAVTRFMVAKD